MEIDKKLDPVTLEVIRNALPAISNEMSYTLQRTSYNMMIYEVRDYCCSLLDTEGNLLSQNTGGVSHFIADLGTVIRDGINKYGIDGFKTGDVIITNHQRIAGQHLTNVVVYTPFYFDGELFAFPTVRAHWVDIGGTSTGFGSAAATLDPWMEGLQIDQLKLFEEGKIDEKLWQLLKDNIRYPESSLGDLRSQLAACRLAERRLDELLKRYGRDVVIGAIKQIFAETEARCRAVVQEMTDGTYEAESLFGGGTVDGEEPLRIKVKVIVKGSEMTIDLTQCSPQREEAVNSRTLAGPRVAYKAITMPLDPVNEGSFRALNILIQEGNFMMARYPAVMVAWSSPIPTVVDTILRALAPAMSDSVPAGHHSSLGGAIVFFGTESGTGKRFVSQSIEGGGWGGRPWEDGESASVSVCQGDVRNAPIEKMELKWPIMVTGRELRQNSGGPGKFRGGLGIITRARNFVDGYWNMISDSVMKHPAYGLWGGKPGAESNGLLRFPEEAEFHTVDVMRHKSAANTEVMFITAGGGGWGNPLERNPEMVRWDIIEGYISMRAAHDEYGVVLSTDTLQIDWEGTALLRKEMGKP